MKFVEKKSEYIVKGIFINGLVCILISFVKDLLDGLNLNIESINIFFMLVGIGRVIIIIIIKYISGFFLLKFLCDALFKLLKISDSLLKE